jgi:hypothetical protein
MAFHFGDTREKTTENDSTQSDDQPRQAIENK